MIQDHPVILAHPVLQDHPGEPVHTVTAGYRHTHTHSIMSVWPFLEVNLGQPVAPLVSSPSPFIPKMCIIFGDRPKLYMSYLTQSKQVFFGRPLCLIPSTSNVVQPSHSVSSLCPNPLNQLFFIIMLTGSNSNSFHSSSVFFLSFSLILHIHLIMLIPFSQSK